MFIIINILLLFPTGAGSFPCPFCSKVSVSKVYVSKVSVSKLERHPLKDHLEETKVKCYRESGRAEKIRY